MRRDHSPATPSFELTGHDLKRLAEVRAMCARFRADPRASIDLELEHMHRDHCFRHRPIVGVPGSLTALGDLAFQRDWLANRAAHMAKAWAAHDAVIEAECRFLEDGAPVELGRAA